jgi:hypothetical protein
MDLKIFFNFKWTQESIAAKGLFNWRSVLKYFSIPLLVVTELPNNFFLPVLRIRIRDPVPFDPWIRDLGWVKNQDTDQGWTTRIIFQEIRNHFFGVKVLSLMRIRDPRWKKLWSGIRDKHPGPQHCFLLISVSMCKDEPETKGKGYFSPFVHKEKWRVSSHIFLV